MELAADFKALLSSIQPDETRGANAKAAYEHLREQLLTDAEFKVVHKDTFLSGSFARDTAIRDINHVDVISLVDIDRFVVEPELALAWTKSILDKYYKTTKRQGGAVCAQAAGGVWLDMVPAIPINGDDGPVWIPDQNAKEWVASDPKGQTRVSTVRNTSTEGYYVQVVKLLKVWRDRPPITTGNPTSYVLESLIHGSIGCPSSHAVAVVNVFEGIEARYRWNRDLNTMPTIYDPGDPSVNIARHWDMKDFKSFMNRVKVTAGTAREALRNEDEAESRRLWRKIFGQQFGS
jgi:Second Messenger Oligonucleotide or Dinucleotide Synthetase domain